jgi:hypothetical protein
MRPLLPGFWLQRFVGEKGYTGRIFPDAHHFVTPTLRQSVYFRPSNFQNKTFKFNF